MLKYFLRLILKSFSILILRRYKPFVIGITGSVGKTSTKEAIFCVLSHKFNQGEMRKSEKNYNNEIGAPLTIIGAESGGKSLIRWLGIFYKASGLILFKHAEYPKIIILEMGADKPGDIKYLTDFIHCRMGIITAIGEMPAHLEFFKTPAQVARAKAALIQSLKSDDSAILNYDDLMVRRMADKTSAKVLTFGFDKGAHIIASHYEGENFTVAYEGESAPFYLNNILGKHQLYPILAAIGAGLQFRMNLKEISGALRGYMPPPGRMRLIKGIKNSWIIDDSYNASPAATIEALGVLNSYEPQGFEVKRKIAVLGDMLELGQYTEQAHRKIGSLAVKSADLIFTIGLRAKFITDEAEKSGFSKENIFSFDTAEEAKTAVWDKVKEGDLILVKGSQGMRMEKITKEIMAEPEKAKELLVRQGKEWK